jgi:small-conductance mechanosensitive channel
MEATLDQMRNVIGAYVPNLLGALAILVIGWLVAWMIAAILNAALRRTELDNRLARWIAGDESVRAIPVEAWISRGVFYLLMIFVLVAFFQSLQLTLPSEPLNRLLVEFFEFVPKVVGAGILLLIAWVLASIVRAIILRVFKAAKIDSRVAEQTESTQQVSLTRTIAGHFLLAYFLAFSACGARRFGARGAADAGSGNGQQGVELFTQYFHRRPDTGRRMVCGTHCP